MITQLLLPLVATIVSYIVFHGLQILYKNLSSPLRRLPGPGIPNLLLGNFKEMTDDPHLTSEWRKEFGPNFVFHGLFSVSELHTSDLKALNHIVTHSDIYRKSEATRDSGRRLVGEGILFAELDQHKRQRRILNPAFGVAQIRAVTEIFIEKSAQLRDLWISRLHGRESTVEVTSGLRQMTLDVIGRAGFGYDFDAMSIHSGKPNALNSAFTDLLHSPQSNFYSSLRLAQGMIPILKLLPLPGRRVLHSARNRMQAIGNQIIKQSKAALAESDAKQKLGARRDLLSVLLKANMSSGLAENQRLSDAEVLAQIPAFFLAGHETTSSATAWALHALSLNQPAQQKLRTELMTVGTDNPTMDELNALPYLDQVIRETLRAHSPAMFTQRKAMQDDVLPLSRPYVDKNGKEYTSLLIPKGQMVHIPLWAVNTSTEIWGVDAAEFKPERWDHIPAAANAVPGVWANLFTFFAGPRNCIGFRFSLAELKAILFTLIRAFEIEPALPKGSIGPCLAGILQRPAVLADKERKSGLPLVLRPIATSEA